ncbi:hypothetical protein HPB47_016095 [Ixodes persulcatus]|uniref:Uncharacterized protein n=1 Tax=Ixodes persulcatus TaxID=34615 RepID=A0AC60QRU3_IXOPE|nr:hypothetical protein HPB47_016095 [Ixodes persulcatus]
MVLRFSSVGELAWIKKSVCPAPGVVFSPWPGALLGQTQQLVAAVGWRIYGSATAAVGILTSGSTPSKARTSFHRDQTPLQCGAIVEPSLSVLTYLELHRMSAGKTQRLQSTDRLCRNKTPLQCGVIVDSWTLPQRHNIPLPASCAGRKHDSRTLLGIRAKDSHPPPPSVFFRGGEVVALSRVIAARTREC